MALKLRRFTVTLCAHRFCSNNLVNFFFKNIFNRFREPMRPTHGEKCGLARIAHREARGRAMDCSDRSRG